MLDLIINILGYLVLGALSIAGLIFFGLLFYIIFMGIIGIFRDEPLEVFSKVGGFIFTCILLWLLWQSDFYYSS